MFSTMMDNSKEIYCVSTKGSSSPQPPPPVDESSEENERDVLLQFISDMLMEEEEEEFSNNKLHDGLALQAIEKSLHDALHNINLDTTSGKSLESNYGSGVKKNNYRSREDGDFSENHRRHKQSANNNADDDESEPLEMYDDVMLCQTAQGKAKKKSQRKPNNIGGGGGKNDDAIDLNGLLIQCAQAMAKADSKTMSDLLCEIRHHSSPTGDGSERVAHYFANGLEAHLACIGTNIYAALDTNRVSTAEVLKSYKMFVISCPFRKMTKILTNRTIGTLDISRATTLHIIDFGILFGFQWPGLIYALSKRPGGPPKLRITGIDFPQPGFRPAERVAETCRRLAKCAERFGVPFEYNAIAKKWDTITLEDVKIAKNELVVVNCMYRLQNVPDETETGNSPRDELLNLIREINPDLFTHGVSNGKYNSPFFVPRFREALIHYSSVFDMFDATIPRDDEDRLLFEERVFGKEAMNIIACEGEERVEMPETYKHWQTRTVRAGFKQVTIDQEIVKNLRRVKMDYHDSFSVEEDGKWILLGWKGRVLKAYSCWRPTNK